MFSQLSSALGSLSNCPVITITESTPDKVKQKKKKKKQLNVVADFLVFI